MDKVRRQLLWSLPQSVLYGMADYIKDCFKFPSCIFLVGYELCKDLIIPDAEYCTGEQDMVCKQQLDERNLIYDLNILQEKVTWGLVGIKLNAADHRKKV